MEPESRQPNVLLIMADQHRADYLGFAGASHVRTPNIDAIAQGGKWFSQCYTTSPVCAPSRIGLATGMLPANIGALNNRAFCPTSLKTYYQQLRDHGYHVGFVGKLDLAKPQSFNGSRGDRPCNYSFGFTHPVEIEGKMHAGKSPTPQGPYGMHLAAEGLYDAFHADYTKRAENDWALSSWDSVVPAEHWADAYIGRRAVEWLDTTPSDFPWHLFVSFVGPHDPFDPPTEYAERWRDAPMPDAIVDDLTGKPNWHGPKQRTDDPAKILETQRQYCAAIEAIDDCVGRVIDKLKAMGQYDNTYIIFASDHGEMLGDHGMYTKSIAYESSWHVPLAVSGPGIAEGGRCDALVELQDLNPTICDLVGVAPAANMEAASLNGLLHERTSTHRQAVVCSEFNFRAIRNQRHKFVENINDRDELYDLETDPSELRNLIDDEPELAKELMAEMNQRFLAREWRR